MVFYQLLAAMHFYVKPDSLILIACNKYTLFLFYNIIYENNEAEIYAILRINLSSRKFWWGGGGTDLKWNV